MAGVSWDKYNEKNPWGKSGKGSDVAVITEDNGHASLRRTEAARAVREGRASGEQRALLAETDAAIQSALGGDAE